jgi:asparagine synthase (glutamine-hydrolysing)
MTGFCGAFARSPRSRGPSAHGLRVETAKGSLSRSNDHIRVFKDQDVFLAFYDNGAFQPNRTIFQTDNAIACVSGDPIIVGPDGVDNDAAASANAISKALISDDDDILRRAVGSFAAASWDARTSTLKLCADKLALRPVYVYLDKENCLFATNLRTLRELTGRLLSVDEQGLAEFIYLGQSFDSRTVYEDVRVLRPAEVLAVTGDRQTSSRYFDWSAIAPRVADEGATCSLLYGTFIQAIRRRSHQPVEDAFLSGGLDSRCVVAGLIDTGRSVRTFDSSYRGSADDVIAKIVAAAFGTHHTGHFHEPRESLTGEFGRANYALYFPRQAVWREEAGRVIWSGDGGSLGLGHVYINESKIAAVAGPISEEGLAQLFRPLRRRGTRMLNAKTAARLRRMAADGVSRVLESIVPRNAERRLFLFYLLNDQSRHFYAHYENIDLHRVEFATPFFDTDFLSAIVASPMNMFLRHHLYNCWLHWFKTPAASLPWQAYPGHEPGPHPMPHGIRSQWQEEWYRGSPARHAARRVATQILSTEDRRVSQYISQSVLHGLRILSLVGLERWNYEVWMARRIFQAITGEAIRS